MTIHDLVRRIKLSFRHVAFPSLAAVGSLLALPGLAVADANVVLVNRTASPVSIRLQGDGVETYVVDRLEPGARRIYDVSSRSSQASLTWFGTDLRGEPVEDGSRYELRSGGRMIRAAVTARRSSTVTVGQPAGTVVVGRPGGVTVGRPSGPVVVGRPEVTYTQPGGPQTVYVPARPRVSEDSPTAEPTQRSQSSDSELPSDQRVIWEFSGGTIALIERGRWYEQQSGYERHYSEVSRTPQYVEIMAIDGSGIGFRLYSNKIEWVTPDVSSWTYRAAGAWQAERRAQWLFEGGYFIDKDNGRWVRSQGGVRREYVESDRIRDYIELTATDGSGDGVRLYDNGICYVRTRQSDWSEGFAGRWNR